MKSDAEQVSTKEDKPTQVSTVGLLLDPHTDYKFGYNQ